MLITRVLKLDASDAQEPFDLTVTPFDTQLKIQAGSASETFTPLVPSALVSDGAELKLTGAKANGDLVGFGSITKGQLRTLLDVSQTNDTADADKPLSTAATTALASKHDKITPISKLPMALVDGLDAAIALMSLHS
jgi:hypothetical protein